MLGSMTGRILGGKFNFPNFWSKLLNVIDLYTVDLHCREVLDQMVHLDSPEHLVIP